MARFTSPDGTGTPGPTGPIGPGVPSGGTEGQILTKIDGTSYNSEWKDPLVAVIAKMEYGSFYDLTTQTGTANSIQAVYCNTIDFNQGTVMENASGGTTNPSRLKILTTGRYNIQFSLQVHQTNSQAVVNLWLRKNGVDVPNSNTKFDVTANNPYYVASWNFFVEATSGDYYELIWSSTSANTKIEYVDVAGDHPAVPSVILTIHQIGL